MAALVTAPDATAAPDVEWRKHDYGREIFARLGQRSPLPFSRAWWDERLMEWSMGDEAVKVQLFRFIDVLPTLGTPEQVSRHLKEYFTEAAPHLPRWLRWGTSILPNDGWAGRVLARTAYRNAERLARR